MTKVKDHPGPWPSIPVSLLPTKCSEQVAAGSRQQEAAATDSRKQQKAAGTNETINIYIMRCIVHREDQRKGARRVACWTDMNLWGADHTPT